MGFVFTIYIYIFPIVSQHLRDVGCKGCQNTGHSVQPLLGEGLLPTLGCNSYSLSNQVYQTSKGGDSTTSYSCEACEESQKKHFLMSFLNLLSCCGYRPLFYLFLP